MAGTRPPFPLPPSPFPPFNGRYTRADQLDEGEDEDESGWKLVHGDVFRFPHYGSLLCALLGTGAQLLALVVAMLCLALMNTFYPGNRGAVYAHPTHMPCARPSSPSPSSPPLLPLCAPGHPHQRLSQPEPKAQHTPPPPTTPFLLPAPF